MLNTEELNKIDEKIEDAKKRIEAEQQMKAYFMQGRTPEQALEAAKSYLETLRKNRQKIEKKLIDEEVKRTNDRIKAEKAAALKFAAFCAIVEGVIGSIEKGISKGIKKIFNGPTR